MSLKCSLCGRFVGENYVVEPVRDTIHPYTADYKYLCPKCAERENK